MCILCRHRLIKPNPSTPNQPLVVECPRISKIPADSIMLFTQVVIRNCPKLVSIERQTTCCKPLLCNYTGKRGSTRPTLLHLDNLPRLRILEGWPWVNEVKVTNAPILPSFPLFTNIDKAWLCDLPALTTMTIPQTLSVLSIQRCGIRSVPRSDSMHTMWLENLPSLTRIEQPAAVHTPYLIAVEIFLVDSLPLLSDAAFDLLAPSLNIIFQEVTQVWDPLQDAHHPDTWRQVCPKLVAAFEKKPEEKSKLLTCIRDAPPGLLSTGLSILSCMNRYNPTKK